MKTCVTLLLMKTVFLRLHYKLFWKDNNFSIFKYLRIFHSSKLCEVESFYNILFLIQSLRFNLVFGQLVCPLALSLSSENFPKPNFTYIDFMMVVINCTLLTKVPVSSNNNRIAVATTVRPEHEQHSLW